MKPFIGLIVGLITFAAHCEEPAKTILEDYRARASAACEKINASLLKEGSALAAKLVANGDSEAAQRLSQQIELRIKCDSEYPKEQPQPLLAQYDAARAQALKPVREASLRRVDAALKAAAGRNMQTVLDLGKAREEIEGGKIAGPLAQQEGATLPLTWEYYSDAGMRGPMNGTLVLSADGTLVLHGPAGTTGKNVGTWQRTDKEGVISATLMRGNQPMEAPGVIRIKGRSAEWERPIGTRYLRAKE